jgi:hypothetical protein
MVQLNRKMQEGEERQNVFKARCGAFKDNGTLQRQYFLERVQADKGKVDTVEESTDIKQGKLIRDEFLHRVHLMREGPKPYDNHGQSKIMGAQRICSDLPGTFPKAKGYTRQADKEGNLVLHKDGERLALIANFVPKLSNVMVDEDGNRILRINVIPAQSLPVSQREAFAIDIFEGENIADKIQSKRKSLTLECNFGRARTNLEAFIMDQAAHVPEELVYTCPGIVKTEQGYDFVDGRGSLRGLNLNVNMQQELGYRFDWPEKYVANSMIKLLQMSKQPEKILPVLLFSVLARISDLFEIAGYRPRSYLQLCGKTGSLKTSVALAVLAPYKNTEGNIPPGTFEDTAAALEIEACRHRGSPFLVDDIHPVRTYADTQRIGKAFNSLVRMYGDGSVKARARGNMKRQKTYKASGLCAFTAEYLLGSESDRARSLIIEVDQKTYERDILSFFQQNPAVVPTFLAYFLRYLLPNAEQVVSYISQHFHDERIKYLGMFEHGRQSDCFACLKITEDLLLQYLSLQGSIENIVETKEKWTEAIFKAVEAGQGGIKELNPVIAFSRIFHQMAATNSLALVPYDSRHENSEKTILGYFDEQYYYLHFDLVFQRVSKEADRQEIPIRMNKKQLMSALANEGIIETFIEYRNGESGEVHTKKVSVSKGERPQMVHINRSVFNQKLEVYANEKRIN